MFNKKKAYLVLENGSVFQADIFGSDNFDSVCGEIVFTTSMVGYLETLTDPSYSGQIVVQTFPLIGNYGVIPQDFDNERIYPSAYIAREFCEEPSNFRCAYTIEKLLRDNNVPTLCNIDTRSLTKQIREYGSMKAKIVKSFDESEKDKLIEELKSYKTDSFIPKVSVKEEKYFCTMKPYKIVMVDFGVHKSEIDAFVNMDFDVIVVPYNTKAERIKKLNPDGIVFSNGAGNPKEETAIIDEIKNIQDLNIPMLGIGMGHQLLALANGADTEKLKYGHRGSSQPVRDLSTNKVYITSQNHGYTVTNDSLKENMKLRFVNINDGTCEGIEYKDKPAMSVQFALQLCAGAQDSGLLLEQFIAMVKERKDNATK